MAESNGERIRITIKDGSCRAATGTHTDRLWMDLQSEAQFKWSDKQISSEFGGEGILTQLYGVDYGQTFALVAKHDPRIRILAIAASEDFEIVQIDIRTAFPYCHLEGEVYIRNLKGYDEVPGKVCKLKRSRYGLKHASRSWNQQMMNYAVVRIENSSVYLRLYAQLESVKHGTQNHLQDQLDNRQENTTKRLRRHSKY